MSRRLPQTASTALFDSGALNQSLQLLRQIGEASNVGVLKGFAGVASLLLEICQTASGNKTEAMALAEDIGQLVMAVVDQVDQHKDDVGADVELLDQISKLCLQLEAVHLSLKNLFKRDSVTWFLKRSGDEVKLQRLQRDIKHAIDLFSLQSSLRLQRNISRSAALDAARKGSILDEIQDVCKAVMDEVRELRHQKSPVPLPKIMVHTPVLPRIQRHFFGREEIIETIITTVTALTPGRVAILGAPGIGKTSVASIVLFDPRVVEYFGRRRYFISCDSASGKDDLLTSIAGPLGLQGGTPQTQILSALGNPDCRSVIVLDNFESPWESNAVGRKEVEGFLASLCSLSTLSVVITMRGSQRPAGVQWSRPFLPQLGPLDTLSARQAFLALSDCLEDDPWIDPLLTAIDRVPLAIALMANLAETDSTETLLARWRDEQSALLHRTPDRNSSLDISIGISLNSPRMKAVPEAFTLLALMSLLPDGIDNSQLVVIFPGIHKCRLALSALWQMSLAYNDGTRTRVLSPIRSHMMLHHQSDTSQRVSMLTYYMGLAGLCSDLGGPHGDAIISRLRPEIGNLQSIVHLVLNSTKESPSMQPLLRGAITAAIDISKFVRYTRLGNPETMQLASVAVNKLDDPVLQAHTLYHLAFVILDTGDKNSDFGEHACTTALSLYEENGNLNGRAESTWLLGQIYKASKKHKECRAWYEQALKLAVEGQNTICQAKCLSCLSEIMFYAGDAEIANDLSQQALKLFRGLGHLTNVGLTLHMLGRIADFRNDHKANEYLDEAQATLRQTGYFHQVGIVLICKGDIAFARCDFYTAQKHYFEVIKLLQELGSLQSKYGGFAQLSLASAAMCLRDYSKAKQWLDKAWHTLENTSTVAHGHMHCEILYGDLALYEERFGEALAFYLQALDTAESMGFLEEQAQCRVKLGTLELTRHRAWVGVQYLMVAAAMQRRIRDVKGLSGTLVLLGQSFAMDGDRSTALAFFRAVYPVCRKIEALRNAADCLVGLGMVCDSPKQVEEGAMLYKQTGDTKGMERCNVLLENFNRRQHLGSSVPR
ncbi:hypothetical protein C8F04DRAFT_42446 [Mycena alexandri]|uniref:Novel STAND NTPase 1 domain-containing protein n=1 Tax=Mycena alexandri TaxID=1745969 RepID=A0AAD6SLX9_9AGAR|nr:hypothetical protein C8F04DRAFT_42446 [Mycena alexandri]